MRNFWFFMKSLIDNWYWYIPAIIGFYKIYEWVKEKKFPKRPIVIVILISFILALFTALYQTNKFEMQRRQKILEALQREYILSGNSISPELAAGTKGPPEEWTNKS